MEFKLGGELVQSLKRLPYKVWYALAEYVDNSTQAYINNKPLMDELYAKTGTILTVKIDYDDKTNILTIEDNSIGMSEDELMRAVIMGKPPEVTNGRSKYGMGLKTASFWLGNKWSVKTKKYGLTEEHSITVDAGQIALNNFDINHIKTDITAEKHYTIITISEVIRNFTGGRTLGKIKDYLRSMYRADLAENKLILIFKGERLEWSKDEITEKLAVENGKPFKSEFDFKIGNKRVYGWAGILEKGSRGEAGFSILQYNRVIVGWPDSYRPNLLFGFQEGGSNDLVNQRLVGELYMDDFDVSHTKDAILFENDEEENLDTMLNEYLGHLKISAQQRRSTQKVVTDDLEARIAESIESIEQELTSNGLRAFLIAHDVPPVDLITMNNESVIEGIKRRVKPTFTVIINNRLNIDLYLRSELSINDPYVLMETTKDADRIIVIVNAAHPFWSQLKNAEAILNYLRFCVYDGVAEWKAYFQGKNLQPDTITWIKDNLLRLPFEMEVN